MNQLCTLVVLLRLTRCPWIWLSVLCAGLSVDTYAQSAYAPDMGINLGSPRHGLTFVDAIKDTRGFQQIGSGDVPVDENGWPTQDAEIVVNDLRNPFKADDPEQYVMDISGTYHLSFSGIADISSCCVNHEFQNKTYDSATNLTTVDFILQEGETAWLFFKFVNTQRTPDSPVNTGITDLEVLRPGYERGTTQRYTDVWLNAIAPFSTLRYMDWTETNNNAEFADEEETMPIEVDWEDREVARTTDATYRGGLPWEIIVDHINTTGKDAWINIPVHASDDYIRELARLMLGVNSSINIYLEYSNELWNYGFTQFNWNYEKARQEVQGGSSNLNYDNSAGNANLWAARRTAKRTIEIAQIFQAEGVGTIGGRLRPVLAWFASAAGSLAAGGPLPTMENVLKYVEDNYGAPSNYFHSISRTGYFGASEIGRLPEGASVEDILDAAERGIPTDFDEFSALADQYGLDFTSYEASPGHTVGTMKNLANRIIAERSERMGEILKRSIVDAWFGSGGDLYMYFATSAYYTRYGFWGMSDDIQKLDRGYKHKALIDVINGTDINPRPIVSIDRLDIGLAGVAYEQTLTAYSGDAPLSWSVTEGSLPDGLSLSADGVISGIPTTAASDSVTITVTDANGDTASRPFSIQVTGTISIPTAPTAPAIDGVAESFWATVPSYSLDNLLRGSRRNATDFSGSFKTAWDAENLYFLIEVVDDTLTTDSEDARKYEDDGIEVYLDINNDKLTSYGPDDYQVVVRYGDPEIIVNPSSSSIAGIERAEAATGSGYIVEMAFPWEGLGEDTAQRGTQIGLDVHATDDDDGGARDAKISWSATEDRSYTDPTTFSTGILEGNSTPAGSNITIYAAGVANTEAMELRVDGQAVQSWTNVGGAARSREFVAYSYQASETVTASQLQVAFTNDGSGKDLRVDRIEVDGTVYQTEAPTTYSLGTYTSENGCGGGYKSSEWLQCNGYFAYDQPGTNIIVYAAGVANTETMELRINGQAVQSWTNVGGAARSREFVAYSYQASETVTASQLQVAFTNDGSGKDLRVDRIEVDGTVYQTEARTTYSTGTYTSDNGCGGGYKGSEWLQCGGYFAYDQVSARTAQTASKRSGDADIKELDPWAVFPNPVYDELHILLPVSEGETVISLTDVLGRQVLERRVSDQREATLAVRQLPQGVYQVRVQQASDHKTFKVLIK